MPDAPAAPAGTEGQQPAAPAPGTPTPPPAAPAPSPADLAAAAAAAAAGQPPAPADPADGDSPWNDPEKAKREIERLRRENGDARINAKTEAAENARKELLNTLTVALGGNPTDGAPPTIETLTEQVGTVTQERDTARESETAAKREAAVLRALVTAGVAPARLDYAEFLLSKRADIAAADVTSDTFGATITAAIADVIANDSSLKTPGASVGTGGPGFSGSDASGQMTKAEFDALPYAKRAELFRTNKAEYDRLVNS